MQRIQTPNLGSLQNLLRREDKGNDMTEEQYNTWRRAWSTDSWGHAWPNNSAAGADEDTTGAADTVGEAAATLHPDDAVGQLTGAGKGGSSSSGGDGKGGKGNKGTSGL